MAKRLQKTPLLSNQELSSSLKSPSPPSTKCSCGEFVGGSTAECAVVCCCCPCGLVNLIVLAVYKLPKGIFRIALRRIRRRRVLRKGNYINAPTCDRDEEVVGYGKSLSRGELVNSDSNGDLSRGGLVNSGRETGDLGYSRHLSRGNLVSFDRESVDLDFDEDLSKGSLVSLDKEIVELEEEMWAKFDGGGFGRCPSQSQMSDKFDASQMGDKFDVSIVST